MARITLIDPGQTVADFSVNGAVITVAGITTDCAERQQDAAVIVEIRERNGTVFESHGGNEGGAFVAHINIPAKVYEQTTVDGDGDEDAQTPAAQPLDPNAISVTLWPFWGQA